MQILILLYIEAGSFIQEDEEGWEFVVLCVRSSPCLLLVPAYSIVLQLREATKARRFSNTGVSFRRILDPFPFLLLPGSRPHALKVLFIPLEPISLLITIQPIRHHTSLPT